MAVQTSWPRRKDRTKGRKHSRFENLESRRLLAVISVQDFGAIPNDGANDSPAIQRAIDSSSPGDTILFGSGTYDLNGQLKLLPGNRTYRGQDGATLRGRTNDGQLLSTRGSDITITGLTFDGGGLFLEDFQGFNQRVVIDNNVFNMNTWGPNANGITFTGGLKDSQITNNLFTGYTGGFGIYGYNYNGLTIANNEFVNVSAGMHIDAFGGSGNLLVEQNYITGAKGMGMEFQSSASNLVFQDNWFEHPNLSTTFNNNNNSMAFSLILDKSSNITIQRNTVLAPERPDGTGCRIGFEVGGDNSLVQENYLNGINNPIAMTDGSGTASVTARNNLILNSKERPVFSFPASGRSFTQINNGADVQLDWDINRGRPQRNHRYGQSDTGAAPGSNITGGGTDSTVSGSQNDSNDSNPTDDTSSAAAPASQEDSTSDDMPTLELPTLETLSPPPPVYQVPEEDLPVLDLTPPVAAALDPVADITVATPTAVITPTPAPPSIAPGSRPLIQALDAPLSPRASLLPSDGLAAPSNALARVVSSDRIDLSWKDNSYTENGYIVERSSDGINWVQAASLGPGVMQYASTNMSPGQTVYFRVCAVSETGRSQYSQVVSATTLSAATAQPVAAGAMATAGPSTIYVEPFRPIQQPTISTPPQPFRPVLPVPYLFSRALI